MSKVLAIIWKDTLVRFSGWAEWVFFIILPVLFTVILAGGSGAPKDGRVLLAVVDQAASPLSAQLRAAFDQSAAVRSETLSLQQAEDRFAQRQIPAVLIIPAQFDQQHLGQDVASLELRQLPNSLDALVAQRAVQAVINRLGAASDIAANSVREAEKIRPFASETERLAYFDAALQRAESAINTAPSRIRVDQGNTPDSIEYDPRANSSTGQMITWVFIPLLGIASLFAAERQTGTLRRLLTTPTHKAIFLLGTLSGQVAAALVQMLLLIGFGALVMKLNWGRDPLALGVMLLSSALAAAALGTTLGTFVKTEGQANGLSIMLGMVLALLGGCWYPMEMFPTAVQTAAKILPTTWAMQGLLDIVLRGQGLSAVLPEAGVLLAFAAVFFTIGIWRFRYE
jgi:ABC-2 type transport system permease protein